MLDINLVRQSPRIVKESLKKRGEKEKLSWVDDLLKKDKEYRALLQKLQDLRHKRNIIALEINKLKKQGKDIKAKIKEAKDLPIKIKEAEERINLLKKIRFYLLSFPNILDKSVPLGKSESDNKVIYKDGKIPEFKFKPKDHLELAENLGLIDRQKAAKVAGSGFVYLRDELALLDHALQRFAIDFLMKRGYRLIEPPFMMNKKAYEGATSLEDFEEVMYKIDGEDLYLIATAEHPIAAMFMNETFNEADLPLKIVAFSPCFRKEVGSHGKYTKGLFRMHQFNKVEQFIFCRPEDSWKYFEELQKNCEDIYKALKLPYRVVEMCSAEVGKRAAKQYDVEVYMADGKYREIGSNSNCTDYQARRLNIKYREKEGLPAKGFVHTLNNTALATSRAMLAILENYQQKDGSIKIPAVLQPYMNGLKKICRKV